jgi:thiamine pyrophosphokinase
MDASGSFVVVVAGGDAVPKRALDGIPTDALVIAADSGVDYALALGIAVDVAIGDFDSVTAEGLDAVEAAGAEIIRYPADKDATDLELALDEAVARGAATVVVIGGHGGRLDHLLANASLLAAPKYATVAISARWGPADVVIVRAGTSVLSGAVGSTVSLLPVHGPAIGVRTSGLRYPLDGEVLPLGTSRGVSNVFDAPTARVSVETGTLLAVLPGNDDEGNPS